MYRILKIDLLHEKTRDVLWNFALTILISLTFVAIDSQNPILHQLPAVCFRVYLVLISFHRKDKAIAMPRLGEHIQPSSLPLIHAQRRRVRVSSQVFRVFSLVLPHSIFHHFPIVRFPLVSSISISLQWRLYFRERTRGLYGAELKGWSWSSRCQERERERTREK